MSKIRGQGHNQIAWGHVISWTTSKKLVGDIQEHLQTKASEGKPFDPVELVNFTASQTQQSWQRKHFREFNYLKVKLPTWGYLLIGGMGILAGLGTAMLNIGSIPVPRRKPGM